MKHGFYRKSVPPKGVSVAAWNPPPGFKAAFHLRKQKDAKRYRMKYAKEVRAKARGRYWRNRDNHIMKVQSRRDIIRDEVFNALGRLCACCGEGNPAFLSIDHVKNDGAEHRRRSNSYWLYWDIKKEGIPKDRYQILCMNCNWGKRYKPECPHKTALKTIFRLELVA